MYRFTKHNNTNTYIWSNKPTNTKKYIKDMSAPN